MRARRFAIVAGALAFVLGGALVACIDLFHGTDFESACDVDAAACSAVDAIAPFDVAAIDAGPPGPTDFCAKFDSNAASNAAAHACAWLGACAGAFGDNAFGACMLHATLAYDCATNPNRPVLGAAHDYWDCLWQVTSCADVTTCLEHSGQRLECAATVVGYRACDPTTTTIITCADGGADHAPPAGVESCGALGQTCTTSGPPACSGSMTACASAGVGPSCDSNGRLHDCDPDGGAFDYGVDCTSFGAGTCTGGSGAAVSGCMPIGDGGTCTPTSDVTCIAGTIASGCPTGLPETVDCKAALGGSGTCDPSAPGRAWDVSRACVGANGCTDDRCGAGTTLDGCYRGAGVSIDCSALGASFTCANARCVNGGP